MRALRMAWIRCGSVGILIACIVSLPTTAEADCGDTYMFSYPEDGAEQVPTNVRVVLSDPKKNDIVLTYADAPEVPVAGKVVEMGGLLVFTPTSELEPNKAMTLEVNGYKIASFVTGAGPDNTAPVVGSIAEIKVIEGTVEKTDSQKSDAGAVDMTIPDGGGCGCGGGSILSHGQHPEPEGSVFDLFHLDLVEATDNTSSQKGLIYKVFTYPTAGAKVAEPAAVFLGVAKIQSACGKAGECAVQSPGPFPSFDFIVGQPACIEVEVEDLAGNVTSTGESCGVVEPWTVDGYCELLTKSALPEPDGGTTPASDASPGDAPKTTEQDGGTADSADSTSSSEASEDGCSCGISSAPRGLVSLLLLLVVLLRRTSRSSPRA